MSRILLGRVLAGAIVLALFAATVSSPFAQQVRDFAKPAVPPLPIMALKVYDVGGKVLVDVKTKVQPKPKNNAFDVMRKLVNVDWDTYAGDIDKKSTGGAFVNTLVGVSPPAGYYWALYVDGKYSEAKGICDIVITEDTLIEWKLDKFKTPKNDRAVKASD